MGMRSAPFSTPSSLLNEKYYALLRVFSNNVSEGVERRWRRSVVSIRMETEFNVVDNVNEAIEQNMKKDGAA